MCGICGTIGYDSTKHIRTMLETIHHRGPDEEGFFHDENLKTSIGIKRLSIIDLKTGSQPYFNEDKSIILVMNGEIYNYKELRIIELTSYKELLWEKSKLRIYLQI